MSQAIAIIGTLDTKGHEVGFLRDQLRGRGHPTIVIDPGILGKPAVPPDIGRQEVAQAGGADLDDLIAAGDKGRAIDTMLAGTRKIVEQLYRQGVIGGVIAVGGGQGTAIGTAAMQALPVGVPKLMVSTIASGPRTFEPYVGTKDVTLMHSVADIVGVNTVTRKIFTNAAAAICAMVEANAAVRVSEKAAIAATMLGLTTPCVLRAKELLESQGFEMVAFHPNGTGGRAMEELIEEDLFQGVLDLSTQEVTGHICNGLFDAGPGRLTAAGRRGIPQVVAPGGTDYIVLGPLDSLSSEQRARPLIIHNPNITLVRTASDEMAAVGHFMAERLNRASGRTVVLVPLQGFSYSDRPGEPFYDPDADAALVEVLDAELRLPVRLQKVDAHINDPVFAEIAVQTMLGLLEE
jgi:uncharacterized protein (UPF0261 family)